MTQYFFVDESGEPGFHQFRGSPYFILAMVQTPNWAPIEELVTLRRALHLPPLFEFHYAKMPSHLRDEFFRAISPVEFRVRATSVLKAELPHFYRQLSGSQLTIELLVNLTLRASPLDISNDILIIDGATDALRSALRVTLSLKCRKLKRIRPFKKIVTASSSREDGLQLADMVAGAIREKAWQNDQTYYRTFAKKIVDEWEVK
jgi:hypothetical protein